jgi:hypothetical protein
MRVDLSCLLLVLLPLASCAGPEEPGDLWPSPTLEAPLPGEGFQMALDYTVPPGEEVWICNVFPIPTDGPAPVYSVEFEQTPGMHHMTISSTGLTPPPTEHGLRECGELYDELMDSVVAVFGSQGSSHDVMNLPPGVAATLPANIDIIHEMHFVNVTDQPIEIFSRVNVYTMDPADVEEGIWGGQVRDEFISLPPEATTTEWSRCVFNRDVAVLFLASHTHGLGQEFTVAPFDGETVGEVFYVNDDLHDPKIVQYIEPMLIPEGQGFEWTCTWDNPNDFEINYGLTSADEMCNLAIVHTPFDVSAQCEVVATSDGVLWSP